MRIEIIGNIASGKTTLANLLCDYMSVVCEDFRSNPFWESFYEDPEKYAFETELTFTLQHYHQIKRTYSREEHFVCDFSLFLDQSYADVTLSGECHKLYVSVLDELKRELGKPDLLICLDCAESILLERIRHRGRSTEESISIEYLNSLSESINNVVQNHSDARKIISIDSGRYDFAYNDDDRSTVRNLVVNAFNAVKASQ